MNNFTASADSMNC